MLLTSILLGAMLLFVIAYVVYGRYLKNVVSLNDAQKTPAHQLQDNIDYVPTSPLIVFGHHFSSIAGAGPIVGPILACLMFGWLPALLWVVLGSILIGGVHDFSSMVASVRHQGRSIAEICKQYMNPIAYRLFLGFIWLALVYIIIAFADLTADSFVKDGAVATASIIYIILAVLFGFTTRTLGVGLGKATVVVVALVLGAIVVGHYYPATLNTITEQSALAQLQLDPRQWWYLLLMVYCCVASVAPVWILLQPRDYISSYLLYLSVLGGTIGILFGGFAIQAPAFAGWDVARSGMLYPMLFITIACGACSGFHSIVASGTTSKQVYRESDTLKIGYGGMLTEAIVAIIALGTIMIIAVVKPSPGEPALDPLQLYATGISRFLEVIGIPAHIGKTFGYLAISTFVLTTLDTATRIGRYIFQEFFGLSNKTGIRYLATFATIIFPLAFAFVKVHDPANPNILIPAYKLIWPLFGATNQLLAALALMTVVVWLKSTGRKYWFALVPALFMFITTFYALIVQVLNAQVTVLIRSIAIVLCVLAVLLFIQSVIVFFRKKQLVSDGSLDKQT